MIIELKLIHQLPKKLLRLLADGCVEIFFCSKVVVVRPLFYCVCGWFFLVTETIRLGKIHVYDVVVEYVDVDDDDDDDDGISKT